jgi:hypothetical protein
MNEQLLLQLKALASRALWEYADIGTYQSTVRHPKDCPCRSCGLRTALAHIYQWGRVQRDALVAGIPTEPPVDERDWSDSTPTTRALGQRHPGIAWLCHLRDKTFYLRPENFVRLAHRYPDVTEGEWLSLLR